MLPYIITIIVLVLSSVRNKGESSRGLVGLAYFAKYGTPPRGSLRKGGGREEFHCFSDDPLAACSSPRC
jgi:hypothetical protein